jgi:hypothetical protein
MNWINELRWTSTPAPRGGEAKRSASLVSNVVAVFGRRCSLGLAAALMLALPVAVAWSQNSAGGPQPSQLPLFVVEIQVGRSWDQSKPASAQLRFKEHSANLKRLRDAGQLVMGARYSDKGLLVLAAASEAAARQELDADPSFKAATFQYQIYPLNVFYPGMVTPPVKKSEAK